MKVTTQAFGKTPQGESVNLFTLENDRNLTVKVTNYGAAVTSIITPDKSGKLADIALGFDNLQQYLGEHPFFGVTCGRYANRIAKATFSLEGKKYRSLAHPLKESHKKILKYLGISESAFCWN